MITIVQVLLASAAAVSLGTASAANATPSREEAMEKIAGIFGEQVTIRLASRRTPEQVEAFIGDFIQRAAGSLTETDVTVLLATNGWFAISLGLMDKAVCKDAIATMIARNQIPADSMCSGSRNIAAAFTMSRGRLQSAIGPRPEEAMAWLDGSTDAPQVPVIASIEEARDEGTPTSKAPAKSIPSPHASLEAPPAIAPQQEAEVVSAAPLETPAALADVSCAVAASADYSHIAYTISDGLRRLGPRTRRTEGLNDIAIVRGAGATERFIDEEGLIGRLSPLCGLRMLTAVPLDLDVHVATYASNDISYRLEKFVRRGGALTTLAMQKVLENAAGLALIELAAGSEVASLMIDNGDYSISAVDPSEIAHASECKSLIHFALSQGPYDLFLMPGRCVDDASFSNLEADEVYFLDYNDLVAFRLEEIVKLAQETEATVMAQAPTPKADQGANAAGSAPPSAPNYDVAQTAQSRTPPPPSETPNPRAASENRTFGTNFRRYFDAVFKGEVTRDLQ
jgi:hypothetical protein